MKIFVVPTLFVISTLLLPLDAFFLPALNIVSAKNNENAIKDLRKEIHGLKDKLNDVRMEVSDIHSKVHLQPDEGWFIPEDRPMQYMITPSKQSWQHSKKVCKLSGGDLAKLSLLSQKTKRQIIEKVQSKFEDSIWVGIDEKVLELLDLGSDYRGCVALNHKYVDVFDVPCSQAQIALCERPV